MSADSQVSAEGRRRVLVHVGTPKTGTSHLQDVLFRNQKVLAKQGINYPGDRFDAHFLAALDLMQLPWAGLEQEAVGAWDQLAGRVRGFAGTSIVSHEILAKASPTQVARALESFGDAEVHVILSVRDLVRQIPAEWQESVKHRSLISYADFLATIQDPARTSKIGAWFWSVQEIPDIINRWGASLPPERIHLVTVPAPGAPRDELWSRFSRAFALDGLEGLDLTPERANPSMGVPETTLVRRINRQVRKSLPAEHYRPLVRELLAHQTLSQTTGSPRLSLSPELETWTLDLSRTWVEEIKARGYDVIGDVEDLLGVAAAASTKGSAKGRTKGADSGGDRAWVDPDRPREASVSRAAIKAIEALLLEAARLREVEEDLNRQLHETRVALDHAHLRPSYVAREKAVRGLERSMPGRAGLKVYRRLRGRANSDSA